MYYLLQNSGDSNKIWYTISWINLLQTDINVSHLTWIMSLHYLVKLEMFIGHVELLLEETPEFIPPQLWTQNLSDVNPVDYSVWEYCKRRRTKYASLIWANWNSDWERSGPSWIMSSLRQPFVSGVVGSSRSVTRVLYNLQALNFLAVPALT